MRFGIFWIIGIFGIVMISCVFAQDVVINEVFYNPLGPDTGKEFVELYNPADYMVQLKGYALESGNGANPNDWTLEWTGTTESIPAKGYFLIGELNVTPKPDFVTSLDLQNSPDGDRLLKNGTIIDTVGYGNLVYPEYYESSPASNVKEGFSLQRVNGIDTNDNSLDFIEGLPTPQNRNQDGLTIQIIVKEQSLVIDSVKMDDEDSTLPGIQILPNPGDAKTFDVTVQMQEVPNLELKAKLNKKVFRFERISANTFRSTLNLSFKDPAKSYLINITSVAGQARGGEVITFEYLPLTAVFIDTHMINFTTQPNSIYQQLGDLDVATASKPTLRNIGNVNIDMGFKGSDLSSTDGIIQPENIEFALGSSFANSIKLSRDFQYAKVSLQPDQKKELSYKVYIPQNVSAGIYSANILVSAVSSE